MASAIRLGTRTVSTVNAQLLPSTITGELVTDALEAWPMSVALLLMLCVDTLSALARPPTWMGWPKSVGRVAPFVRLSVASVEVCKHVEGVSNASATCGDGKQART